VSQPFGRDTYYPSLSFVIGAMRRAHVSEPIGREATHGTDCVQVRQRPEADPRDNKDYVSLIVKIRDGTLADEALA